MMGDKYKIFLYAPEGPAVIGATLIPCLSNFNRQEIFGKDDPHRLPAWPSEEQAASFNASVILNMKVEPHDIILLTGGWGQRTIKTAFPNNICCEPGVGYEGWFTDFCAFESAAWRHYTYGKKDIKDGRWFDTVIPNYFDTDDFLTPVKEKKNYLLYVGRAIARKGIHVAAEIAHRVDLPLYVAGAGAKQVGSDIVAPEITVKNVNYLGPLDILLRATWMQKAQALLCPTTYIEPFGGVAVEAMIAGTPVISSDWGAFTETVEQGVTGYRIKTLKEGVEAVEKCKDLHPFEISEVAIRKYSLKRVAPLFEAWFNQLDSLWTEGWYKL